MTLFPARCCGVGQTLVGGRCEGRASSCAVDQHFVESEAELAGCVYDESRVALRGGKLPAGSVDWQVAAGNVPLTVAPFAIDRGEVTIRRYAECVRAGACEKLGGEQEPGMPVTGVSAVQAQRFCSFAKGRLPSSAEWRFAAGGSEGRRFPWGYTGLVCRRASFGLVKGPCGTESSGPELVGARPDGATPDGIVDLSGNVAEWTRDPDGRARARGGSYRSRVAAELVTAAVEVPQARAAYVGFRCAYDVD